MDNGSSVELIKQIGAILVALIGATGAIIAAIIQVRGAEKIQELIQKIELIKAISPTPKNEALQKQLEELDTLVTKKQDVSRKRQKSIFYILPPSILFLILGVILIWSFKTPSLQVCPYQGATDNETIVNLIQAEATASNTKVISIVQSIFDPAAIFYDFASQPAKSWNGPLARYRDDLFKTTDFRNVEHLGIISVGSGISGNTAYYSSGSKGDYRIAGGAWKSFFNGSLESIPPTQFGSEHWILKKNTVGCWVIVQMEFNAGHVKFPR